MKTVISINAKCSDCFSATLYRDEKFVGKYQGSVPQFFPGNHYGDYVELKIDAETGQILNWKKPTEAQLFETFEEQEEEQE